jgi:hypothetical protein
LFFFFGLCFCAATRKKKKAMHLLFFVGLLNFFSLIWDRWVFVCKHWWPFVFVFWWSLYICTDKENLKKERTNFYWLILTDAINHRLNDTIWFIRSSYTYHPITNIFFSPLTHFLWCGSGTEKKLCSSSTNKRTDRHGCW